MLPVTPEPLIGTAVRHQLPPPPPPPPPPEKPPEKPLEPLDEGVETIAPEVLLEKLSMDSEKYPGEKA